MMIDKSQNDHKISCRICKQDNEIIDHICKFMLETEQVQKEYKSRQSDPLGPVRKMWVQGKQEVVYVTNCSRECA